MALIVDDANQSKLGVQSLGIDGYLGRKLRNSGRNRENLCFVLIIDCLAKMATNLYMKNYLTIILSLTGVIYP